MIPSASADRELSNLLLEQADRLLRAEVTREVLAGADAGAFPAALWQLCEEAGLTAALLPESAGGAGVALADGMRLVRQFGYHAVPLPLAETMLGQALWSSAGGAPADGSMTLVPDAGLQLRVRGAQRTLSGQALRVPWGGSVQHLLLEARDEQGVRWLVRVPQAAVRSEPVRNLAFEPRDGVRFDDVQLDQAMVRAAPRQRLFDVGALMRAQQMAGAMERCLDFALTYAMERQQFGRPIGKFQAIQHLLAEAAGHYAAAVAAAGLATDAWGSAQFGFGVAVAKARVGEAAGKVAAIAHQVHGAMGFTQEHPLHFSTRRLWSWRDEFGSEAQWQARLGRWVCAAGGAALWPALAGDRPLDGTPS